MWTILPAVSFIALFIILISKKNHTQSDILEWRGNFLKASILFGVFIVLTTESLSLLHGIKPIALKMVWGFTSMLLIYICWKRRAFRHAWEGIRNWARKYHAFVNVVFVGILLIMISFLLAIALKAIPNNTDALLYHMSRVAHWMQNKSLQHYNTQYVHQLVTPPLAEMIILHLGILAGTDQVANLVQWFSMLGSILGVSLITKLMGVGVRGQLLAAFFCVSIPIGILQATSTQTDYVTSFWLICLIYFVLKSKLGILEKHEWMFLGFSTGLGMCTKWVFYIYAFPILLWFIFPGLRRNRIRTTIINGVGIAGIAVLLNSGIWARNLQTFGTPLGPSEFVTDNSNILIEPRTIVASITQQTSLDFVSTIPKFNNLILRGISGLHDFLGLEGIDFTFIPGWNHEDLAANPLHMSLIFLSIFFLLFLNDRRLRLVRRYAWVTLCGFFLIAILLEYNPFTVRFHLPLFAMWGVVFAAIACAIDLNRWVYVCCILFVIASIPWLLFNSTRSAIAIRPYTRLGGSIFQETTRAILFANWHSISDTYIEATEEIQELGCKQVGLNIDSHDVEYPFWRLLDAPESGIRIEAVGDYPYLEGYKDPSYSPCIVICSLCGDKEEYLGLGKYLELNGGFTLYAQ